MRDDGMAGIQAPPWIERTPELTGELANARPTTEPFTRPDGTTAHRVTGWRLQSGEVISQEEFGRRAAASRAASGAPPSAPAP